MKINKRFLVITLFFSFFLFPEAWAVAVERALIFGGNCEESNHWLTNRFSESMRGAGVALKNRNWDVEVLYDGELARCEVEDQSPRCRVTPRPVDCCRAIDSWSVKNFEKAGLGSSIPRAGRAELLASLHRAAADMEKEGGKLLVSINTHGSDEHGICLSDGSMMSVSDPDFVAALERIARNKKAKLAVVDESCFGGGTVTELGPKLGPGVCLLSAQASTREAEMGRGITERIPDYVSKAASPTLENLYFEVLEQAGQQPLNSNFPEESHWGDYMIARSPLNFMDKVDGGNCLNTDSLQELLRATKNLEDIGLAALVKAYDNSTAAFEGITKKLHALSEDERQLRSKISEIKTDLVVDLRELSPAAKDAALKFVVALERQAQKSKKNASVLVKEDRIMFLKEVNSGTADAEKAIESLANVISLRAEQPARAAVKKELGLILHKSWEKAWLQDGFDKREALENSRKAINHAIGKLIEPAIKAQEEMIRQGAAVRLYSMKSSIRNSPRSRSCAEFAL